MSIAPTSVLMWIASLTAAEPPDYRVLLEVGGGVNVPATRYVDVETDDGYMFADNSLHGQFNAALLFGGFSFRYAANVVSVDYFEELLPEALHENLGTALSSLGAETPPRYQDGRINKTLSFHTFSIGYRFYFTSSRWQPYLPLEIGAAVVSGEALEDKALYGANLGTGFGVDVQLWGPLWAGLALRYTFVITEGYPETAIIGVTSSDPSFESAIAMAHLIGVSAQLQVRY